jgi:hypothetical protein
MQDASNTPAVSSTSMMRGLLPSLLLNIAIPLALYFLAKRFNASEITALSLASLFPLVDSIFGIVRHRSLDILAVIALLGTGVGIVGVLLGGNESLILIRESFFTGALGLTCFFSLLLPRPLMFYFGRHFMAGRDPAKLASFNAQWQHPYARFVHRLITVVWGTVFLGEFLIRVLLVLNLPHALVLAVSPVILTIITIATFTWTFAYVHWTDTVLSYAHADFLEAPLSQSLMSYAAPCAKGCRPALQRNRQCHRTSSASFQT